MDPLDGVGLTRGATPVELALMGRAGSSRSTLTSLRTSTSFSSGLLRLTVSLPFVPPVRVLAVDPDPRLDPDANLLIDPGPDDAEPEPEVDDADADAEPIGNLPSLSLALLRLVGAAAAPPPPFAFPFRNAPCSYFLRMYFSSSLSLSSAPVVDGRGKADSLGFQTALAAVLPIERMWTICSRVQSSRVTDLLWA